VSHRLRSGGRPAKSIVTIRRMLGGEDVAQEDTGLFPREWRELRAFLQLD
jgi:hypothetical protein